MILEILQRNTQAHIVTTVLENRTAPSVWYLSDIPRHNTSKNMQNYRILTDKIAKAAIKMKFLSLNHPACNNIVDGYLFLHRKIAKIGRGSPTYFDGVEPKQQKKIPRFHMVRYIWLKIGDLLEDYPTHHFH